MDSVEGVWRLIHRLNSDNLFFFRLYRKYFVNALKKIWYSIGKQFDILLCMDEFYLSSCFSLIKSHLEVSTYLAHFVTLHSKLLILNFCYKIKNIFRLESILYYTRWHLSFSIKLKMIFFWPLFVFFLMNQYLIDDVFHNDKK